VVVRNLSQSWPVLIFRKWIWLVGFLPVALDFLAAYIPPAWIPLPIANLIQELPSANATVFLFAAGFLVSAYLVHRDLTERLADLRSAQASLSLVATEVVFIHDEPILTREGRFDDGLRPNGVPVQAIAAALLEIHNLGMEEGELDWHLVLEESDLPSCFHLYESDHDGQIVDIPDAIPPRARVKCSWRLECGIAHNDPTGFALSLRKADTFSMLVRYRTLRVGDPSPYRSLQLKGSLQPYKATILERWRARGLADLVQIGGNPAA
jgi:hypothetical protein